MSQKAKHENRVVRAVTLPVGAPIGRSWEELNAALPGLFRLATDAANWCVHALFRRDTPNEPKTPQAVKPRGKTNPGGFYSYGEYAAQHPGYKADWKGATQSLNICLRYAERKYRDVRHAVMVRHDTGLLTVRYPYPFPVDADAWRPGYADGGFPTVTMGLPGLGMTMLRLKRRADFGRKLKMFRKFLPGPNGEPPEAQKCEAALYRNRKGNLLVKLVGWFPRRNSERVHACYLHTDPNALLVAEIDGRSVTVTNGDHCRRILARIRTLRERHRVFLQRVAEDRKREVRMDPEQRANLNKHVEARCQKQRDRIDTHVGQIACQVARFLERQKVATVAYDDSNKTYIPEGFPWHDLKEGIRQRLDGIGVEWVDGTDGTQNRKAG